MENEKDRDPTAGFSSRRSLVIRRFFSALFIVLNIPVLALCVIATVQGAGSMLVSLFLPLLSIAAILSNYKAMQQLQLLISVVDYANSERYRQKKKIDELYGRE